MSIQDDIFDLDKMLKDKAAAQAWYRVRDCFYAMEKAYDRQDAILADLKAGIRAVRILLREVS